MNNNVIDLLLNLDAETLERPSKEIKLNRLSKILGTEVKVLVKGLTFDKYAEIQDKCLAIKTGEVKYDTQESQIQLCMNGVFDLEGKRLFTNKDLQAKFKVSNSKELVKKLLLSGEISSIGNIISELTGYGDQAIEEIKN